MFECDISRCLSVAVLCTISGVNRCTLIMVLYPGRMSQCGLHVALRSPICTIMRLLAAGPRSTSGLLFPCQYLNGKILVTRIRWCWTAGFQEQGQCLLIDLAARSLFAAYCFPFRFFHYMGCCCGAGVFGLIGC